MFQVCYTQASILVLIFIRYRGYNLGVMAVKHYALQKPNQTLTAIGRVVRDARRMNKLSQTELAQKVKLNQKTISALENGAEGTEVRTILRVFSALRLKIDIGLLGSQKTIYSSQDRNMQRAVQYLHAPDRENVISTLRKQADRLKKIGVETLILFGSTARGESGPDSDIDLAYELSVAPDLFTIGKIEDMIQDLFHHKIDLVRLKSMKAEVRKTAERDMIHVIG